MSASMRPRASCGADHHILPLSKTRRGGKMLRTETKNETRPALKRALPLRHPIERKSFPSRQQHAVTCPPRVAHDGLARRDAPVGRAADGVNVVALVPAEWVLLELGVAIAIEHILALAL